MIFVDTSALLAILSRQDQAHSSAKPIWHQFALNETSLYCSNYLIVEALALIQNRLGMPAVHEFRHKMLPLIQIEWITEEQHHLALERFLMANRRQLSFVDCSSFTCMLCLGIRKVFTFDTHFAEQGFEMIPGVGG